MTPAATTPSPAARVLTCMALGVPWLLGVPVVPGLAGQEVTLTPLATLEGARGVTALDFSGDGSRLLAAHEGGVVLLYEPGAGERPRAAFPHDSDLVFVGFLAADTAFVAVGRGGHITVHPLAAPEEGIRPLATFTAGARPVRAALDAGRRYLAVATEASRVELFDLTTRQSLGEADARDLDGDLLHVGFDRQGRQLVAVSSRGAVTAWNPANLEPLRRVTLQGEDLHGSRSVVHAAGADRGANILAVALEEVALPRGGVRGPARPGDLVRRDKIIVFDWHSGARIREVPIPDRVVGHLAVGPGNDHAVVAHGDRVDVVDLRAGERGAGFTAPAQVTRIAMARDNDRLAVGTRDGHLSLWEMAYRAPATVDELPHDVPGLSGRLRILGDDTPAIQPEDEVILAVLPFDDRMGDDRMATLVPELLTTQLANVAHLTLVERLRVDDLLQELDLRRQGITEARGLELGRMLNADYVLLGSVGALGGTITLSARLLRVETGEAVSGRQVTCEECRAQDLFDAIHLLGTAIAR